MPPYLPLLRLLLLHVAAALPFAASAQESICGHLANAYGPFDYRKDKDKLGIVEQFHFTPLVEALIRGRSAPLPSDLDYTLRAFPNHHRALVAVMNLGAKVGSPHPPGLPRAVECYFERAIRFKPDDAAARILYSEFLKRQGRTAEVQAQLESAEKVAEGDAKLMESVGLALSEVGRFDAAAALARRVVALGVQPDRLIALLRGRGQWTEAAAGAASAASAP